MAPDSVVGGIEGGEKFYLCRTADRDGLHPGKFKPHGSGCSIVSDGHEVIEPAFEVLAPRWVTGSIGLIPVAAAPRGRVGDGDQYVCGAAVDANL